MCPGVQPISIYSQEKSESRVMAKRNFSGTPNPRRPTFGCTPSLTAWVQVPVRALFNPKSENFRFSQIAPKMVQMDELACFMNSLCKITPFGAFWDSLGPFWHFSNFGIWGFERFFKGTSGGPSLPPKIRKFSIFPNRSQNGPNG